MSKREKALPEPKDRIIALPDFPVYKQQTDHTCGPSTMQMTLEFLGLEVSERRLALECLVTPWGSLHWTFEAALRRNLKKIGCTARMVGDAPNVYERIVSSLEEGMPVPFIYVTMDYFHQAKRVMHYAVVIGIDEPAGTIKIANPFGWIEDMPLAEWWGRFSILEDYAPRIEGLAVDIGLLKPRTAFFIDRI